MQFCETQGDPVSVIGERVPVAAARFSDQVLPPQLPQFIADACGRRLLRLGPEPSDQHLPKFGIGEGLEAEPGAAEGRQDPHRPRRANPEPGTRCPPFVEGVTSRSSVERSKAVACATACAFWKRVMA